MSTKQIVGLILLVLGLILLYLGYGSSQGLDDQFSEAVTGEYTDRTLWYWILGASSTLVGIIMLAMKR